MISRRTILLLGKAYEDRFDTPPHNIFEFMYEAGYDSELCRRARDITATNGAKQFIIAFAEGHILRNDDPQKQANQIGAILHRLAQDILVATALSRDTWRVQEEAAARRKAAPRMTILEPFGGGKSVVGDDGGITRLFQGGFYSEFDTLDSLQSSLELDGYRFDGRHLLQYEVDVLNTIHEEGILHSSYRHAGLDEDQTAFHFLGLANEHFVNQKWSDAIHNARQFLEFTMKQVARKWTSHSGVSFDNFDEPGKVRSFLERMDVLSFREQQMLDVLYGLLSNTGSHPYVAASDQARLSLNMVLTYTQFILMRLIGKQRSPP